MASRTRNIIIISILGISIGVGTYLYLRRRKRITANEKSEKTAGKTVKGWEELKENLPSNLPINEIKEGGSKTIDGMNRAEKIWSKYAFATLNNDGSVKNKFVPYYYADGDFTIYDSTDAKNYKWVASGKWIDKSGLKVNIYPKPHGESFGIEKGKYEGISVANLFEQIFNQPIAYYNPETKRFSI